MHAAARRFFLISLFDSLQKPRQPLFAHPPGPGFVDVVIVKIKELQPATDLTGDKSNTVRSTVIPLSHLGECWPFALVDFPRHGGAFGSIRMYRNDADSCPQSSYCCLINGNIGTRMSDERHHCHLCCKIGTRPSCFPKPSRAAGKASIQGITIVELFSSHTFKIKQETHRRRIQTYRNSEEAKGEGGTSLVRASTGCMIVAISLLVCRLCRPPICTTIRPILSLAPPSLASATSRFAIDDAEARFHPRTASI